MSKNLDQQAFLRAESDPREVLNQVKKMQPSFGYGTYPAQIVNPYQFGSETAAFGVPRSISQHHQREERKGFFLITGMAPHTANIYNDFLIKIVFFDNSASLKFEIVK